MCLSTRRLLPPSRARIPGAWARLPIAIACLAVVSLGAPGAQAEPCSLHLLYELAVTMQDLVPTVHAKVNGKEAVFEADSGAFFSSITPSAAQMFHLSHASSSGPIELIGVGGTTQAWLTRVDTFTIFGMDLP